jgi:putative phage-type endonuclease
MTDELIQGSPEWIAARVGSLGASRLHEALARTKTGWGASRANLLAELACERLTQVPADKFVNAAMQNGIALEPEARAAYAWFCDVDVVEVGLIKHPTIVGSHASPDGLVGGEGLVEIKAPQPATHLATLLGDTIPRKYLLQMAWQMACSGRQWCDFVSWCPVFPEPMQLFVKRVHRADAMIETIEGEAREFLAEVDATVAELRARYEGGPSPLLDALTQSVALETSP